MRVAIVHYHLSPGGVTSVITSASAELRQAGNPHVVLCGPSLSPPDLPIRIVENLGYPCDAESISPSQLLSRLREAATDALGAPPDIWHFHNHSLGKHPHLAAVVSMLAQQKERLLLQIHDLAEDGRPANFPTIARQSDLYPTSAGILYAFINTHDRDIFIQSGLPHQSAVWLPNSTREPPASHAPPSNGPPLLLAPHRGIRRKNLGELVLLSAHLPAHAKIAVTRAPVDRAALAIHRDWEKYASNLGLPIEFAVCDRIPPGPGKPADFPSWIRHASHFVTTSVSEGFGMIWPEAVFHRKPVIGRNLPRVTRDHPTPSGCLYDRIVVPLEAIDIDELRRTLITVAGKTLALYQRPITTRWTDEALSSILGEKGVDFGNLPEFLQQRLISTGPSFHIQQGSHFIPLASWLRSALDHQPSPISEVARPCLARIYYDLMNAPSEASSSSVDKHKVLDSYLSPDRFHFLLSPPARPPRPFKAFIFDIYGTLLVSKSGAIRSDPPMDPILRQILAEHGVEPGPSPTHSLHQSVLDAHHRSPHFHPEIDFLQMLKTTFRIPSDIDPLLLLIAIENAWHPANPMPGASEILHFLANRGIKLGLLSNAQANTLPLLDRHLGKVSSLFDPLLIILSYQHLIAKPSLHLFQNMADSLKRMGISPEETLFIGNDPLQDIAPATTVGFRTALFTGHPDSLRPGGSPSDFIIEALDDLRLLIHNDSQPIHITRFVDLPR